jgi:hypothetical protein
LWSRPLLVCRGLPCVYLEGWVEHVAHMCLVPLVSRVCDGECWCLGFDVGVVVCAVRMAGGHCDCAWKSADGGEVRHPRHSLTCVASSHWPRHYVCRVITWPRRHIGHVIALANSTFGHVTILVTILATSTWNALGIFVRARSWFNIVFD